MADRSEIVVLAHGLYGHPCLMYVLGRRLRRQGFGTKNWGYPSFVGTIERHAGNLRRVFDELEADEAVSRVHMVTHSMGGIVGWCALQEGIPDKFGRFALLTPPGRGSWLATVFGRAVRWVSPAIDQMSTRPDSFVNRLVTLDGVEVGVMGATLDLVVPPRYSHMLGEREHRVYPGLHHQVLFRADVARDVVRFLQSGSFASSDGA